VVSVNDGNAAADIGLVAKAVAARATRRCGLDELVPLVRSDRAQRILKAAVSAGRLGDDGFGSILADWRVASGAFFGSLRTASVFFRLWDSGGRRVPTQTRLGIVSSNATAWSRNEGQPIPITTLTLTGPSITLHDAASMIVMTREVAENMSAEANNLVATELRGAVAQTVDVEFFDLIMDSGTPSTPSLGNDLDSFKADVRWLFDQVSMAGGRSFLFAMDRATANAATFYDDRGAMSPMGGELFGIPAMVSDAIPAGTLRLIRADDLALALDPIRLDASDEAAIQMLDNPTNNSVTPTATNMVSLFQTDGVALRAVVSFAAELVKADAIAEVTDIAWGAASGS